MRWVDEIAIMCDDHMWNAQRIGERRIMKLDSRLAALGFSLKGTVLQGKSIVNCAITPRANGVEVVTPSGETIFVEGATGIDLGDITVSGPGKIGLIL